MNPNDNNADNADNTNNADNALTAYDVTAPTGKGIHEDRNANAFTASDFTAQVGQVIHEQPSVDAPLYDPSNLTARAASDSEYHIETLDGGPERLIVVLSDALRTTADRLRDKFNGYTLGPVQTYPAIVVRERAAEDAGKPDNATDWKIVGIFRHVQLLDGATFEFNSDPGTWLERANYSNATLVLRTRGRVRVFTNMRDTPIEESSHIPC